jgi:hypothetical protein
MTKKNTPTSKTPTDDALATPVPGETPVEETPFEAVASICSVLVVGLFILTWLWTGSALLHPQNGCH